MASTVIEQFIGRIDAFLERSGMSPTAFGLAVCNDGSFVTDLRAGDREPRLSTIERVDCYIRERETELEVAHAVSAPVRQAG